MGRRRGRGEGGVERLPSGSWRGVVCRTNPDGTRTRTSKTFESKADLLDWMRAVEPTPGGTLGEWITAWLALHRADVSAGAYRTDRQVCDRHLAPAPLARLRLSAVTPLLCRSFLAGLTCSESERHKAGRTLRMVCHAAARAGLVNRSPMHGVKVPPPPKPDTHALTADELGRVIVTADALGHGAFFRVAADAGLRPQELAGLAADDFDPAAGTLRVERAVCRTTGRVKTPKTRESRRVVRLSPVTLAALAARPPAGGPWLFPAPRGGHWLLRNLSERVYAPVIRASGVRMTPYTLRHTMATLLLRAGVNAKVVAARLGHKDVTTTLRVYAHVMPDDQERAAAVMGGFLAPHAIPTTPEVSPQE